MAIAESQAVDWWFFCPRHLTQAVGYQVLHSQFPPPAGCFQLILRIQLTSSWCLGTRKDRSWQVGRLFGCRHPVQRPCVSPCYFQQNCQGQEIGTAYEWLHIITTPEGKSSSLAEGCSQASVSFGPTPGRCFRGSHF